MHIGAKVRWWKVLWLICGTICGLYAAYVAYRFNYANTKDGQDALVLAIEFVVLTAGANLLPPFAIWLWRHVNIIVSLLASVVLLGGWIGLMSVVLMNSSGFLASGRTAVDTVVDNGLRAFNTAKAEYDKAQVHLDSLTHEPLWEQTQECGKRTRVSRAFCAEYDNARAEKAKYEPIVMKGHPIASNSQVQYRLVTRLTGISEAELAEDVPVMQAVILELAAMIFFIAMQLADVARASSEAERHAEIASPQIAVPEPTPEPLPTTPAVPQRETRTGKKRRRNSGRKRNRKVIRFPVTRTIH